MTARAWPACCATCCGPLSPPSVSVGPRTGACATGSNGPTPTAAPPWSMGPSTSSPSSSPCCPGLDSTCLRLPWTARTGGQAPRPGPHPAAHQAQAPKAARPMGQAAATRCQRAALRSQPLLVRGAHALYLRHRRRNLRALRPGTAALRRARHRPRGHRGSARRDRASPTPPNSNSRLLSPERHPSSSWTFERRRSPGHTIALLDRDPTTDLTRAAPAAACADLHTNALTCHELTSHTSLAPPFHEAYSLPGPHPATPRPALTPMPAPASPRHRPLIATRLRAWCCWEPGS